MKKLINISDYRLKAKKNLPKIIYDYLDGGADSEYALKNNETVFDDIKFIPKRLTDISHRDIKCKLFNRVWSAPIAIAPTGLNSLFWPYADLVLAKSAKKNEIPFILSSASNTSIEEVAKSSDGEKWFQLYVVHNLHAEMLVKRALNSGYSALVVTLDVAINGNRVRDLKNGFGLPLKITPSLLLDGLLHPGWSLRFLKNGKPELANFVSNNNNLEIQAALMSRQMDASFDYESLKKIRDIWPHKLIVKGILDPNDALQCVNLGVDAVIFSNHGGRQHGSHISPIEVLKEPFKLEKPLLIDSGFRTGADIVKALCMGANMVCLGRSILYGLACAGEEGVDEVIRMTKIDIDRTMAQIGCSSLSQLNRDFIRFN